MKPPTSQGKVYCNERCIVEVAQELGLPVKVVREIVSTQSEYTRMIMESNTFDSIRLPYMGIFKSKPKELQMINHLRGMTPEQAREFKHAVRTGKIKLNTWEKKDDKL